MKKVTNCDICRSKDSEAIFTEQGINFKRCRTCGFIYSGAINERVFERKESPKEIFRETEYIRTPTYTRVLRTIKSFKTSGKLLDVGCRTGNFMTKAERFGFEPYGVEISRKFSSFAQGLGFEVYNSTLEEARLLRKSFDIVTYLSVLEHILTPSQELTQVRRVLKDDGLLVIETPNSNFQLIKGKLFKSLGFEPGLMPLNHVVYFSKRTIKLALAKTGFQILTIQLANEVISEGGIARVYSCLMPVLEYLRIGNNLIVYSSPLLPNAAT